MASDFGPIATKITQQFDAWVVGGAAFPGVENPKDIDILVPAYRWHEAALVIPPTAEPNSFGGWKFRDGDTMVDVWPGDLGWIMQNRKTIHVWHPRTGVRFSRSHDENTGHT